MEKRQKIREKRHAHLVFKVHGGRVTLSPPYYNIQGPKANLFFEKLEKIFYGQTKVQKNRVSSCHPVQHVEKVRRP